VKSSKRSAAWSVTGASSLVKNRVYLGEARSGKYVNPSAHEAIVTRAEFDAAQIQRTVLSPRDGSVASLAMLGGLVRCAGCGHTLKIAGGRIRSTGERYASYYCVGRYAKGACPARATIRASHLDDYVEQQVLAALTAGDGFVAQALVETDELTEAQRRLETAEHELTLYLQTDLISTVGPDAFLAGVETRQHAVDEARDELGALHAQSAVFEQLPSGDLSEMWPRLELQERRTLMHGLLDRVVLQRDETKGRNPAPLSERTQIVLRGNVLLEPTET
jgi:hypothetical protein